MPVDQLFTASSVKARSCCCRKQGSKASTEQQRHRGDPYRMGVFAVTSHTVQEFLLASCWTLPCTQTEPVHLGSASLLPTAAASVSPEPPLLACYLQQLTCRVMQSTSHSVSPTATPSHRHMHRASPQTLLSAVIHVEGHIQECSHPFPTALLPYTHSHSHGCLP